MLPLRELQQSFSNDIYRKETSLADSIAHTETLANNLDGEQRLALYRSSVFGILTDALTAIYPIVQKLVGEHFFEYMAKHYIAAHPSHSGDLHDYGEYLATFVTDFEPARELVYLPDVARLEWHYHRVFHAADTPPLTTDMLSTLSPSEQAALHIDLHPAARLLDSQYPVHLIWQANLDDDNDQEVDLDDEQARVLIIRRIYEDDISSNKEHRVEVHQLNAPEYALLTALTNGEPFQQACEKCLAVDTGFDISTCLFKHISQQTFSAVT